MILSNFFILTPFFVILSNTHHQFLLNNVGKMKNDF